MVSREHDEIIGELMAHPDFAAKNRYTFESTENEPDLYLPPSDHARSFGVLMERAFASIWHSKKVWLIQIVAYVAIAAFAGIENYGIGNDATRVLKNIGCVLHTILFIVLIASIPTTLTFPQKMADFVRTNRSSKNSMLALYVAQLLVGLPFHLVFSSFYILCVYSLTSQPKDVIHLYTFSSVCVLTALVSYSLGLLLAVELSGKPNTTQGTVSLALIVSAVLSAGFVMDFNSFPNYLKWLTWISYVRYAFEGALIGLYGFGRPKLNCANVYCHFKNPQLVLGDFSIEENSYFTDANALVCVFLAFQIFALLLLLWKVRSN